jgi:two-component system cell cycle sensor histidine kinase PleC
MSIAAASQLTHEEFERRVLARQLELLAAPTRGAVIATPIWAAVVCWIVSGAFPALGTVPLTASLSWLAVIVAVSIGTALVDAGYRRASVDPATFDPKVWMGRYTSALALLSAVWSSLIWVFWVDGNPTNQLSLTILVFCGITNGIISRMNKFETFLVGSGFAVFVLWSKFLTESSDVAQIFAVLLPFWFLAMSLNVRAASSQVRRNIVVQVENETLNGAIAKARDDAELARQAAERANQMKSSFLANMSHELRTPLNAILGFSEVIASNGFGEAPERYRAYAHDIHGSGHHLLSLINDILDVAKIEAGKMKLDSEWLDGRAVFDETLKLVRDRAAARNVELRTRCDGDARVYADARAFKQIVLNLLSNAIKFTSAGHVSVALSGDGALAVLVVEDTGCGISQAEIARVFNAFEQADNRYAHAQGGTGLGLTLVRALSELHGGSCAIESKEGEGTRVEVRLPFPKDALGAATKALSRAA